MFTPLQVVSILSVWKVLEDKLIRDTRSIVIERICDLFSLVPSLQVQTQEYEVGLLPLYMILVQSKNNGWKSPVFKGF